VNSQGDAIHQCNLARAVGAMGAGIMGGVISDGVSGLAASQAAGELGLVQVLANASGDAGDGRADITGYRTTTAQWFIRNSDDGTLVLVPWGAPGLADVPQTRRPSGGSREDARLPRHRPGGLPADESLVRR
jgi:hypothetical protein